MNWADGKRAYFGNSSDLQIFHDGSNSYINDTSTGELFIQGDAYIGIRAYDTNANMGLFFKGGGVELFHNGNKKFETTSSGITVTGSCSGCDFNFSNMNPDNPPANEVDGTRGSWTLQEGADDLFLINRLNGKKYKFNLTEIT